MFFWAGVVGCCLPGFSCNCTLLGALGPGRVVRPSGGECDEPNTLKEKPDRGAEGASAPEGAIADIGQISARVPIGIGSSRSRPHALSRGLADLRPFLHIGKKQKCWMSFVRDLTFTVTSPWASSYPGLHMELKLAQLELSHWLLRAVKELKRQKAAPGGNGGSMMKLAQV